MLLLRAGPRRAPGRGTRHEERVVHGIRTAHETAQSDGGAHVGTHAVEVRAGRLIEPFQTLTPDDAIVELRETDAIHQVLKRESRTGPHPSFDVLLDDRTAEAFDNQRRRPARSVILVPDVGLVVVRAQ